MSEQADHIQAMNQALRRELNVSHYFLVTQSGIAARLTPEEAQAVRGLPGIKSVERERLYHATTFRSPEFIGANQIWDGTAVPPGSSGTKGEGIIIAMLDTGIDANPSLLCQRSGLRPRHDRTGQAAERSGLFQHRPQRLV